MVAIPQQTWVWRARLDHVVDGDTVALYIDRGMKDYKITSIRLTECWAQERFTEQGKLATKFVRDWMKEAAGVRRPEWPLVLRTYKDENVDKYDRWVGRVWSINSGHCLNEDMVKAGLATRTKDG